MAKNRLYIRLVFVLLHFVFCQSFSRQRRFIEAATDGWSLTGEFLLKIPLDSSGFDPANHPNKFVAEVSRKLIDKLHIIIMQQFVISRVGLLAWSKFFHCVI